ncbi:hypothetical protein KOW79_019709 [Hemibagrus wyckioides]|uniref:Uncharacterized protein n=1 Tax=Hemibagrus wyckioides TaxID=337641 RepID=A0A9D3N667_9TELE|nr:hypothetical protein KOW79_019709 [Hemibagrus wyckioides]
MGETQVKISDCAGPSSSSMSSDVCTESPPGLNNEDFSSTHSKNQIRRSDLPSCVSMKSERSMFLPTVFKDKSESSPRYSDLQRGRDKTEQKIIITDTGCSDLGKQQELIGADSAEEDVEGVEGQDTRSVLNTNSGLGSSTQASALRMSS